MWVSRAVNHLASDSVFRADDTRSRSQRAGALARQAVSLARLPPRVGVFYLRALRRARAAGDRWSLDTVTRPHELADVLRAAGGAKECVEIGTATGWTSLALALARSGRRVHTFDPVAREHREAYAALVPGAIRERVVFHLQPGDADPLPETAPVEFLFVDGEHTREATIASYQAWEAGWRRAPSSRSTTTEIRPTPAWPRP